MRPSRMRWLLAVCVAGLASCVVSYAEPGPPGLSARSVDCGRVEDARRVEVFDHGFGPMHAGIPDGGVVMWTNTGALVHTVTSGDPEDEDAGSLFDSGDLVPGESYCLQFRGAGTVSYFCRPHPTTMRDATVEID